MFLICDGANPTMSNTFHFITPIYVLILNILCFNHFNVDKPRLIKEIHNIVKVDFVYPYTIGQL